MNPKYIFALSFCGLIAIGSVAQQPIPNDEIRIGTRPYVPGGSSALHVKSNLVEVPVIVHDDQWKPIGGLQKSDFEVYDNGKKQGISLFTVETAPRKAAAQPPQPPTVSGESVAATPPSSPPAKPRYIAFYFDDFSMPEGDLAFARRAAEQFVRESVQPGDHVGIFTSSTTESVTFTDDKDKLLKTLSQLRTHQRRADLTSACPGLLPYQAYLVLQFSGEHSDALDLGLGMCGACASAPPPKYTCVQAAAREQLALTERFSLDTLGIISDVIEFLGKMPGRRMLILTSSGFLTQTLREQQEKVIRAALRADVVINSLDAKGLYAEWIGGNPADGIPAPPLSVPLHPPGWPQVYLDQLISMQHQLYNDPLAAMAEETGGRFFHNNNDLLRGIREMAAVPEVSYVLGFDPVSLKPDGTLHTLKVKLVNQRGLAVEARRGYFAPAPPTKSEILSAEKLGKLDDEVRSTDATADVPTDLTTQTTNLDGGGATLKVSVHVDVRNLPFQTRDGRHVERLIFVTALFDSKDQFLMGEQQVTDMSLKDATLTQLSTNGITANISLQAPVGNYRLREVVQETWGGHLTAISRPVEIR